MSKFGSHKALGTDRYWAGLRKHKRWQRDIERSAELTALRAENERLKAELMAARSALIECTRELETALVASVESEGGEL